MTIQDPGGSTATEGAGASVPAPAETSKAGAPRRRFYILYVLAAFGLWLGITTPSGITLSVRTAELDPENAEALFSMIFGLGGLIAIPLGPIIGALSDGTRSRFGRRAPYLVAGAAMQLGGALIVASFSELPMLLIGWSILQAGNSVANPALWAIISDRVPERRQGLMSGFSGMALNVSSMAGTYVIAQLTDSYTMFLIPGAVGLAFVLAFVISEREPSSAKSDQVSKFDLRATLGELKINPIKEHRVFLAVLAIILLTGAIGVTVFAPFLLERVAAAGTALDEYVTFTLITTLVALIAAPLAGRLSDKLGRPKTVYAAGAIFTALGLAVMVMVPSLAGFMLGGAILGIGQGVQSGQSIALVIALGDEKSAGRNLGLVGLAQQLPSSTFPLLAPFLLAIGSPAGDNYFALWMFGAVVALAVLPVLALIRPSRVAVSAAVEPQVAPAVAG